MALTSCLRHLPVNHSTMVGRYCSLSSILQPLLAHAVSSSQPLRTTIRISNGRGYTTCMYVHTFPLHTIISTSYPYIHHTCIAACPDAVLGATHHPRRRVDRRISSALFAPTFLALSPCPCKNAGLPFRRLRIDCERACLACLEASLVLNLFGGRR